MKRTTQLRSLINAPDILVMPGVFDGYSARLVARGPSLDTDPKS